MKKHYLFLFLLLLSISCQEDLLYREDSFISINEDSSTSIMEDYETVAETVLIDQPYTFFSETDFNKWSHIVGLENRFKACEIPESLLKIMTTDALLKTVLHYPLNYLLCFYNDPFQAIDIIMERSALHQEFVKRPDAAKVILDSFENTVISFEEVVVSKDYKTLSYIDEMFLEYFMASKNLKEFSNPVAKERLKIIVERKIEDRANDDNYSYISLIPLDRINTKEKLGVNLMKYSTYKEALRSTLIYTYFGKTLYGNTYPELSTRDIVDYTLAAIAEHPDAYVIHPATALFNCHSYAWYNNQDITSNNIWLNYSYNGIDQLPRYWTNDLYIGCTESQAEKVFYYNGDHSALPLNSGNYISKWGAGPLMEHAPTDCPYISDRVYYKARTDFPLNMIQVSGNTIIFPNEPNNYIGSYFNNRPFTYVWSVDYWYDQTTPFSLQQIVSDEYQLTCYEDGMYTIRIDAYDNGINIAYGELNVNCIPDL